MAMVTFEPNDTVGELCNGSEFPLDVCPRPTPQARGSAPSLLDQIKSPSSLRTLQRHQLPQLADELRADLISTVAKTGGHLGSGLGVVELTVALHYVFETPDDKLIWDVSHQCYPHKILTGRREAMATLRQADGISGFTSRQESAYDPFGAAHSSTAISAALGFAVARDLIGASHHVVAVVGDGAASGGMAFEGLNNVGAQGRPLTIVLNDNNMSIAPPSGSLANHLSGLRACLPPRAVLREAVSRQPLQNFTGGPTLFDQLGVTYCGPYDGHDVELLATVLAAARAATGPVIVHVVTEKGHGYAPAVAASDCYHGVGSFDAATGKLAKATPRAPAYTKVFAEALIQAADADERIVAITAAMPSGTGLDLFARRFPNRCFDVGIAEQHAATFAAGLAAEGLVPFAAIYSTFLQRGYDQIVHDVAIQSLPVRFAIDRAGLVGADGVTHQGSYDIAYLGCLPGFVLMAPADEAELQHMLATAIAIDDRPSALRYPRGEGTGCALPVTPLALEIGRGRIVREGTDVAILSYGTALSRSLEAADRLEAAGISVTVADARFAKPIDAELVRRLGREHPLLVTLEDGSVGGFSTQVMAEMTKFPRHDAARCRLLPMHLPDRFIEHGSQSQQEAWARLDTAAITTRIQKALGVNPSHAMTAECNSVK